MSRLVFVGEAVLDVVTWVDRLPVRGGDTVATDATMTAGGGFNVMAAAASHGMEVVFAGRHGTGPAGDIVRAALAGAGIRLLRPADRATDSGFVVAVVDGDGERTFVTSPAALLSLGAAELAAVPIAPGDVVYVSGYGLVPAGGGRLAAWVAALPDAVTVVADPGSLVTDIPADRLGAVADRADWWSCNRDEAAACTGRRDPRAAAEALARRRDRGGVVVRSGSEGCLLVERPLPTPQAPTPQAPTPQARHFAAPGVAVVDTTGAGDTHVGVMMAGLAAGLTPAGAVRRATVAAALSVTRRGPATAPTAAELDGWLRAHGEPA